MIRIGLAIGVAAALLGVAGCTGGEPARDELQARGPRDVVLITIDTLRWDATGFSGAGKVETPWLDRLADEGWVAEAAHAHAVMTLPSHASILTGLPPYDHGIRDNAGFTLSPEIPTLATRLAAAEWATGAFVSAFPLDRRFGLGSGFETYDDDYEGYATGPFTFPERPGHATVARALEWWDARRGKRRLMWVHLFTPHFPYAPRAPWASRYPDRPYYGDVAMTDAELEPLIERLLDPTGPAPIIVVTSDHGESLGEHGEDTHGVFAYESTLKVPFLIHAPGLLPAGSDGREARHIDIVPTLLDLLGLDGFDGLAGRTLFSSAWEGDGPGTYFEALTANINRGWAPLYGRIDGGSKAIRLPEPELYDLATDPVEARNRVEIDRATYDALIVGIAEEAYETGDREVVDEEVLERLRSLGYVASASPSEASEHDASADPKNLIHHDRALQGALTAYASGRPDEAIRTLRELLAEQPRMAVAYGHLSFMYSDLGRTDEAVELLERARATGVDTEDLRRKLALSLLRLGRADEAAEVLRPDSASENPETQSALGRVAAARGRTREALERFDRALELDSSFPAGLIDRGTLLLAEGEVEQAIGYLQRGLEADPGHAEGWNALGVARSQRGDATQAIEAWRKAVEVDPRLPDALFNLSMGLAGTGRRAEAELYLERYATLVQGAERRRALDLLARLRKS
ncbi:MAG: sulfatase-like hydrolase/transferase [bacterium]|nr:sulfatase-like hydrolase/transferase [bacterium]